MRPPSYPEIIWDFEWSGPKSRYGEIRIRTTTGDEQLFESSERVRAWPYDVILPRPFMDTALMDAGGWQRRPIDDAHAMRLGAQMWQSLADGLRDPLNAAADVAQPLRLRIASTGSGIDDIPWEWLNDGARRYALDPAVRFVRSIQVPHPEPALTVEPPLRVLLLTTNPKDERLLNAWTEIDAIRAGLDAHGYVLRVLEEPTAEALRRALAEEPHIVHYVGHAAIGQGTGYLILHDYSGGSYWLCPAELAEMLPASVRLLCLGTCFTAQNYNVGGLPRFGHASAELHLPTTLVNQYAITEAGARTFWSTFYPALLQADGDAVEALQRGRMATAAIGGTCDWASYSLIVRDRMGRPFRLAQPGERTADRYASEIQAQFSARLANDLALRIGELGANASEILKRGHAKVYAALNDLEKKIE